MSQPTPRLDQLAAEIRAKTNLATRLSGGPLVDLIGDILAVQLTQEESALDARDAGIALMDAAIRLQLIVTELGGRVGGQGVVSMLAAAGERLYTGNVDPEWVAL